MPADFIITQGDQEPIFTQQITAVNGQLVDLTDAAISLELRSLTQPTPLTITGTVSSPSPINGIAQWTPSNTDTADATPGDYMGKWKVVYANGKTQHYPTDGWIWVEIQPSLQNIGQALVSLPEVKDYLNSFGINRTHDDKLLGYIYAATPVIENIVGPIVVRTVEEWHDGGQFWIQLRRRPSTSLGTTPILQILGCDEYRGPIKYPLTVIAEPTQATIYSVMLNAQSGTLYRRSTGGGVIPFGAGWTGSLPMAVHVTYQTGQATVPPNVRTATLEAIREYYQNTMPTGAGSRSLADTFDQGSTVGFSTYLDRFARGALAPNRRRPAIA